MAAIEKTFYGTSSAQKVKSKEITGTSAVEALGTAGLLWGFSGSSTALGEIKDDTTVIALISKNAVWFEKPVPFSTSLDITLSAGKAVVYYE
jgi:hypothetical protein